MTVSRWPCPTSEAETPPACRAGGRSYAELPDLPAIRELIPSFGGVFSWHGILVPAGGAKPIIDKLNRAMADYLRSPEGITQMKSIGAGAVGSAPQRMAEQVRDECALWIDVIGSANLTIQ